MSSIASAFESDLTDVHLLKTFCYTLYSGLALASQKQSNIMHEKKQTR